MCPPPQQVGGQWFTPLGHWVSTVQPLGILFYFNRVLFSSSLQALTGSSSHCPSALIPITSCLKIDAPWFDREASEDIHTGDKLIPCANWELLGV